MVMQKYTSKEIIPDSIEIHYYETNRSEITWYNNSSKT